jgi:hypothetical protein
MLASTRTERGHAYELAVGDDQQPQSVSCGSASFVANFGAAEGDTEASASGYTSDSIALKVFDESRPMSRRDFDALDLLDPPSCRNSSRTRGIVVGTTGSGGFARPRRLEDGASSCSSVVHLVVNNIPTTKTVARVDPLGNTVGGLLQLTFDSGSASITPVMGCDDVQGGVGSGYTPTVFRPRSAPMPVHDEQDVAGLLELVGATRVAAHGEAACLAAELGMSCRPTCATGRSGTLARCLQATSVIIGARTGLRR